MFVLNVFKIKHLHYTAYNCDEKINKVNYY